MALKKNYRIILNNTTYRFYLQKEAIKFIEQYDMICFNNTVYNRHDKPIGKLIKANKKPEREKLTEKDFTTLEIRVIMKLLGSLDAEKCDHNLINRESYHRTKK
jgi:fructose-1,6-bisphosphatase